MEYFTLSLYTVLNTKVVSDYIERSTIIIMIIQLHSQTVTTQYVL